MKHYYKDLDATGKVITVTDYRQAVCFENGYRYAAGHVCNLLNKVTNKKYRPSPWQVGDEYDTVNGEEISFYVVYKED